LGGNLLHSKARTGCTIFAAIIIIIIIITASQYKQILGYFYPLKYKSIIIEYSTEYGIDPYLVSAIINVESRYNPTAESHKSAKGLMQITSSTGKWAADEIGIKNYDESLLFDPNINIRIGCWYINNLKKEFDLADARSDVILMLAAYNGGSGNVKKWLKDKEYSQTGTELDQIPFKETEEYVNKVLNHYKIYKKLYPDI
jgi:soluble lytic murein transglycosylase